MPHPGTISADWKQPHGDCCQAILLQTLVGTLVGMAAGLVAELIYVGKAAGLDLVIILAIALILLFLCCAPRKEPYRSSVPADAQSAAKAVA